MRILTMAVTGLLASVSLASVAFAEQIDNTQTLPDAKPGECYAKVITPAKFDTESEEIVLQEASERIETIEAEYETKEQAVVVKEASVNIMPVPAVIEERTEKIEVREAEVGWTTKVGDETLPADPGALGQIASSGVELETVEPGTCFSEYYVDAKYKTDSVRVLVKEAFQTITVMPAKYEEEEEQVLVKEESTEVVDVPAVYRTETESVLVEPERSVWQEGCGIVEQVENTTGETMCMVQLPARYETLTKTVLDKPASTKSVTIPAEYKTVMVQRLVEPASEKREDIPAEYSTVSKRVKVADAEFFWLAKGVSPEENARPTGREVCLSERAAEFAEVTKQVIVEEATVSTEAVPAEFESVAVQTLLTAASDRRVEIPARTKVVTSQVQVEPSKLEWRKVLCRINMTTEIITELQTALEREGYNPGPVDGIVGRGTMEAMEQFQIDQGIDRRGLTYEALQLLDVNP